MRQRAELLTPIHNTHRQYNLLEIGKKIADKANRDGVAGRFPDPAVHESSAADLALIGHDDQWLRDVELSILKAAKQDDANTLSWLPTMPGIGEIVSLVRLYEMHDSQRFPRGQDFVIWCSLTTQAHRRGAFATSGGAPCWAGVACIPALSRRLLANCSRVSTYMRNR